MPIASIGVKPPCPPRKVTASDFYLIAAESPEDIAAKLFHTVTERIPQKFGFHPSQ